MAWLPKPRRPIAEEEAPPAETPRRRSATTILTSYVGRFAASRGLYRIFNPAIYRFYASATNSPPNPATDLIGTSPTLDYATFDSFADGTWYVSVSYFDGVLDSGFLPVGPNGQTYLTLVIIGGVIQPTPPSPPHPAALTALIGGALKLAAAYFPVPDGANAATEWAIAFTSDGSTPPVNSPSITVPMAKSTSMHILSFDGFSFPDGTVVKVQLQVRRGGAYSDPLPVLTATARVAGPAGPLSLQSWPGALPEESS